MSIFLSVLLVTLLIRTLPKIHSHSYKKIIIICLSWACLGSVISFNTLMPYKSEGMHFVQYGIGGMLSLLAFRNLFTALTFSYLFGIIDETFQVYVLDGLYLDFNDMILNFWGSLLGVMVMSIYFNWQVSTKRSWLREYFFLGTWIYAGIFGIMWVLEICTHYRDDGGWIHFLNHDRNLYDPSFWYQVIWGDKWHQLRPFPGFVLILLTPMLFLFLRKYERL